jgi:hypothetical protein
VTAKKVDAIARGASRERVDSPAPVYLAARRIETARGPVLTGQTIDVSGWPPGAIRVSLSAGEIVVGHPGGHPRYVVAPGRRLRVGDGWLTAGDPVPDSTWRSSRGARCYLGSGDIVDNPAATSRAAPL